MLEECDDEDDTDSNSDWSSANEPDSILTIQMLIEIFSFAL